MDPLGFVAERARSGGVLPEFSLGGRTHVLVHQPQLVRQLFVTHYDRFIKPTFLRDSNRGHFGDGLTTLEGAAWRTRSALLRPAFTPEALQHHRAALAEHARDWVAAWRHGQTIDLRHELRMVVARNAARIVFNAELVGYGSRQTNAERAGLLPVAEAYGEDFTAVATGDGRVPLALRRPRAPRDMTQTLRIIDEGHGGDEGGPDVLSLVRRRGLERDAIVGELVQMLYAGHHTVPATLVHFWSRLAAHPHVAAQVVAEARQAPPEGSGTSRSYIETALRETMRLHAPAPLLYREVHTSVQMADRTLPPGTSVWACPHLLHRDRAHFAEPDQFSSERFALGLSALPRHSYLPFGAGPRICIAHRLAMLQMQTLVRHTVSQVVLHPRGGSHFEVQRVRHP